MNPNDDWKIDNNGAANGRDKKNNIRNNFVRWFTSWIFFLAKVTLNKSLKEYINKKISMPNKLRYMLSFTVKPKAVIATVNNNQVFCFVMKYL